MEEEQNIQVDQEEDDKDLLPENSLDEDSEALLTPEERISRRSALMPDISWLKNAVKDDMFIPVKGDYFIAEMYSVLDDRHPWLDTRVYMLTKDPADNGDLKLYDPARGQCAAMNWKTALKAGYVLKLTPPGRNPETLFESSSGRRKKFEKPAYVIKHEQKLLEEENVISSDAQPPAPPEQRRGRGRPPGAKNRPKDVIRAEKEARRQELAAKRAKRGRK